MDRKPERLLVAENQYKEFKKSGKKIILNNNHYKDDLTFYHITPPAINAFTTAGDPVSVLYTSF